ncbi:MAG: adenosylmethionine--8-amino-7-oxononanoate transaminase [Oleispira antarctica]|uniref:Adenosylmethionine-8-amino-7-oxononanoate aminotransferase n=1 Tax=Oleispira antarctica RB-8 TaxID=698738 RepID=R4YLB1_OLEAN|nr:adenosylmethionine--8-amino-7-oxononanoate transaminase [Oleispira antarctica]MBQ0792894.1 adenosylmethionine--8-amino-7-oxononanoate transaminase [Oleispira antarctica]CCK75471.1 Adenosylmethionine-8-amino-7-oxononanoate transaminase [Oleispira antarctica RB-8]
MKSTSEPISTNQLAADFSFQTSASDALAYDQQHLWHPYSSFANKEQAVWPVESAKGVYLTLADGTELIDGMSSWWSTVHGYSHPRMVKAISEQAAKMSHVMFGGLTHEPAINLAYKLVQLTPEGLNKVFLSDSGSVAVEVAVKMAIQYQQARGKSEKTKLIALKKGYHGDTLGAMSLCDPTTGMHHLFSDLLAQQFFIREPQITFDQAWHDEDIEPLRQCLEKNHQKIAALILEPIVQGAGGMRFYHPTYLKRARQLCDEYDVLLIADEIATGFGRSGKLFACEHSGISPDILCVGKALTAGYMTLAATLTTDHIADTISAGEAGCFMHGPTFMANPLACAAANESLSLLIDNNWQAQVERLERGLEAGLSLAKTLDAVADVRVLGAIGVIEMKKAVDMKRIQPACIAQGIWLRPFGKLVYIMPAYVMTDGELEKLTAGILKVLKSGQF